MCNEHEFYKVAGHIPVFNFFYSGIRGIVYASQGNMAEAERSGIGMIPFAHSAREGTQAAVDAATNAATKKLHELAGGAADLAKAAPMTLAKYIIGVLAAHPWIAVGVAMSVVIGIYLIVRWARSRKDAKEKKRMAEYESMVRKVVMEQMASGESPSGRPLMT